MVFLDLKLGQESSPNVLQEILRISPRTKLIMFTAFASIDTAVDAMRRGTFDYLPRPFTPDQIRQALAHVERTQRLENRVAELDYRLATEGPEINLETRSESMQPTSEIRLGGRFTFEEIEAEHIRRLLSSTSTLEEAAKILDVDPATFYRKRKRL